jgi:uncharacterized membrane protein
MSAPQPTPTQGTGLSPNVAGALAYLLGPITGIIFLVTEKNNQFVRFHAMQSIVFGVACVALWVVLTVLTGILSVVPILGFLVSTLLALAAGLGCIVLWLVLMFRAYQGQEWELPWLGQFARKQLGQSV